MEFIFDDVRKRLESGFNFRVVTAPKESNGILNRILNILYITFRQGRVNHVTGDIHYVTYLLNKQGTILTILDCGFMKEPNRFKRNVFRILWLQIPVRKSKIVTTISEASKTDIVNYTSCDPTKISVIPVAVDQLYVPMPKVFNGALPTLLQIGTASNKNVERLIEALQGLECLLIIIGRLSENQLQLLEQCGIKYINKSNLSQEEMYTEYCNSDIVTFASTFEGFGMPIIEANCVERPVIAGNNSSMPEVGADAACYVDAFSVESIRKGIELVIKDDTYRNILIENGRRNRKRFSNDVIASMYGEIYLRLSQEMEA